MGDNKLLALNEVDVSIKEGEFVSIMGSSGSGKSTLMNIIGCLDVPTSGDYFFRNKNISNYNSNMLAELRNKDIGFIFQNFNLLKGPTSIEHTLYTSHSIWNSKDDFENWKSSEAFRKAHRGGGQHQGIYLGHPEFEGFEVIL